MIISSPVQQSHQNQISKPDMIKPIIMQSETNHAKVTKRNSPQCGIYLRFSCQSKPKTHFDTAKPSRFTLEITEQNDP
jgi:hypothetical protein